MNSEPARSMRDNEHFMLGRILMDTGFRDLFLHDPDSAAAALDLRLSPDSVQRLRRQLQAISDMDPTTKATLSSMLSSLDRWKVE